MPGFQFSLHSVLRHRERLRDEAAQAMRQAQAALDKLHGEIHRLTQESAEQNEFRHRASLNIVNVQQLIDVQRHQLFLAQQIAGIRNNVTIVEKELETRRRKLVSCEQAVRVLEKLREKQSAQFELVALARQQARLDEWASNRHFANQVHINSNPGDPNK